MTIPALENVRYFKLFARCSNCVYWEAHSKTSGSGECRRNAPVSTSWQTTVAKAWCGDWIGSRADINEWMRDFDQEVERPAGSVKDAKEKEGS